MYYTLHRVSVQDEVKKALQLEVTIKDRKFNIFYNKNLLEKLGIVEEDFSTLAESLREILNPSEIDGDKKLVTLYVVKTETTAAGTDEVEVSQELKAKSNNKDFTPYLCKKVNHALLKDIFFKMGVDEASIEKYVK